ncbi:hypothetical protein MHYP_G00251280 [Metynnis hypsauchen]
MMRRVFGEEKASGVRDSMDEYIKHVSMRINEPLKALEETECLEKQLSDQADLSEDLQACQILSDVASVRLRSEEEPMRMMLMSEPCCLSSKSRESESSLEDLGVFHLPS